MISDANRYYGAVISIIVDFSEDEVRIKKIPKTCAGFYLINDLLPLYIKYSTSRRGPWVFNFQKSHQEIQQNLYENYSECIVAFVCGKDGVAALSHESFRNVLDESFDHQEAVTIRRKHNEMYRVRGKDGVLERRVSRSSLQDILKQTINKKAVI
jgi:hypothetical protein